MEQHTILEGYSDQEKGAYLGAIASIATADRQASEEELSYLHELADAAGVSDSQRQMVEQAAADTSGSDLMRFLDVLKGSDLRHSLVTDLIAFAKADANYSPEEEAGIKQISDYLGVSQQQYSLLDQFAQTAVQNPEAAQAQAAAGPQNLFGFGDKMKSAGINTGGLLKGLLSMAAPMLIGSMMSRGLGGGRRGGGMLGGGLPGGLGGMLGGGGLGSLIGMLGGGRSFGSTGGLLGKILGGGRF